MARIALFSQNRRLIECVTAGVNERYDITVQFFSSSRYFDAHTDILVFGADYIFVDSLGDRKISSSISFCEKLRKEIRFIHNLCLLIGCEDVCIADKAKQKQIVDDYVIINDLLNDFCTKLASL